MRLPLVFGDNYSAFVDIFAGGKKFFISAGEIADARVSFLFDNLAGAFGRHRAQRVTADGFFFRA